MGPSELCLDGIGTVLEKILEFVVEWQRSIPQIFGYFFCQ